MGPAARTYLRFWVPALAALAALALAGPAQADYEQVGLFGQEGDGEQLQASKGAAVNYTGAGGVEAGSVYVAGVERVSRYSPTGGIKEVWGWKTIASGPDLPDKVQSITVKATSGTYTLSASTAGGSGIFDEGSNVVHSVTTSFGAFHVGDTVSAVESLPAGATIIAVGPGTLELSVAATKGGTRSISATTATETTAPIPYNASAAEVKEALVALPAFGPGDVSVTGGPGDAGATTPYEVTFEGVWAGMRQTTGLTAADVVLAGGVPSSSVAIATLVDPDAPRYERCRPENGDVCTPQKSNGQFHEEAPGYFNGADGVAVDQGTGYVYVLNKIESGLREHNLIEVFSADGSELITRFGDAGAGNESFETGAEKIHGTPAGKVGIAVGVDGKVYLSDNRQNSGEARVMCFRPETPGDYEHYVYCGRSADVNLTVGASYFENIALDDAGHVYVATQAAVEERSLAEPTAPPLCTYNTNGQLRAMTANPLNGEVFYYKAGGDRRIYRLDPCDPKTGLFEEAQTPLAGSPASGTIRGLAFNPTLSWGPERPPGVLYGADGGYGAFGEWPSGDVPHSKGLGYILAPAEAHSPEVLAESVSNTRTTSAALHAEINPNGQATRYVFQYESKAEYEANEPGERFAGAMEAPPGGGEIGGGSIGEAVVSISGLEPDTAYRFRVIATSECNGAGGEPCVAEGEALSFATYPLFPPGLPDHRVYELVSPAQKHGGEVIPAEPAFGSCEEECKPNGSLSGYVFPMQSSPDGEALAYEGQPFDPFEGAVNYDSYVARRSASGWQSTALIPASPANVTEVAFDAGLDHGLQGPINGFEAQSRLEIQSTSEPGPTTPLLTEAAPNRGGGLQIYYAGQSADFSRIFFAANDTLTEATAFAPEPPDPGASKYDLYEWHEGRLSVLNVLPGNGAIATGAEHRPTVASRNPDTHAVSEDGTRAFFEDEAGDLYVRIDGEVTTQINDAGHFLSASPDGSQVLLTDGCLYAVEAGTCTDLTEGEGGFLGLLGQSKDLSHIYFVDTEALGGGEANEAGEVAEAGKGNLYSWSGGEAHFVAQLLHEIEAGKPRDSADWAADPAARTAEAGPDGRFLAFASKASLTGYDNVGPCGREYSFELGEYVNVDVPCNEAFLYDSATGKLVCASCNPTGEAPLGPSTLRRIGTPFTFEQFPQPRYLTDEGRLYFDTQDSLVARDTNEGVEDVYEYSPQGAGAEGTCEREAGCTRLISAGTEPVDSNLIAVDETGKNVFFDTRDKLALKDKDELLDIYDAREGGGIAAESEISRAECQGENCQAPVSPPNDPTPGSSTFEGAGNVKEPSAAKKHKKAKKKHKRHSKKKHAKKHKKQSKKKAKKARTAKRNHGGAK